MSETLKDIVQAACGELVLPVPDMVIGSTDDFAIAMLAMAHAAGRDLVRTYEWGNLITLATYPTVAGQSDYPLPADYHRMINDTSWDRSTNWRVGGPLTPQADRYLRESRIAQATIYRSFRLLGNRLIRITPTPSDASGLIVYEYLSRAWILHNSTPALLFTADTDTTVFDFDLMVKECKWRWMFAKGQDSAEYKRERDDALALFIAADQGGGVLDMGGCYAADDGGYVIATPSPNFRLSDGSGNNLIVD